MAYCRGALFPGSRSLYRNAQNESPHAQILAQGGRAFLLSAANGRAVLDYVLALLYGAKGELVTLCYVLGKRYALIYAALFKLLRHMRRCFLTVCGVQLQLHPAYGVFISLLSFSFSAFIAFIAVL